MMNTFIANADGTKHDFIEGEVEFKGLNPNLTARFCTCDEDTTNISEIPDWSSTENIAKARKQRYEEELPIEDQLDTLWKALESMGGLPAEAAAVIAKRNQIKDELPYG